MKHSSESRIVNVTCQAYKAVDINFEDLNFLKEYNEKYAYAQSKLALILMTLQLNKLLQNTNIDVYAVDPGYVESNLARHTSISGSIISPLFSTFLKTPAKGAEKVVFCCIEPNLKSGKLYR